MSINEGLHKYTYDRFKDLIYFFPEHDWLFSEKYRGKMINFFYTTSFNIVEIAQQEPNLNKQDVIDEILCGFLNAENFKTKALEILELIEHKE